MNTASNAVVHAAALVKTVSGNYVHAFTACGIHPGGLKIANRKDEVTCRACLKSHRMKNIFEK